MSRRQPVRYGIAEDFLLNCAFLFSINSRIDPSGGEVYPGPALTAFAGFSSIFHQHNGAVRPILPISVYSFPYVDHGAGLRDMDAILGRDDRLVAKLADAAEKLDVTFAAVIGTPVPAVIGTDYRALERMLAKKTELPVLTVNTDGMELYDRGEEKAYLALFEKFSDKNEESEDMNDKDRPHIGIIGMTPQDVSDLKAADKIRKVYADQGMRAICYGMGDGLDEVRNASLAAKNVVVSPAALKAAQYLQKKFGTPYEIAYPLASELVPEVNYQGKKILIVQQQVIANAVRKEIEKRTGEKEAITTATWFMRKEEILTDLNVDAVDDISLKEEDDFISLVEKEGYDVIFADPCMERMIPGFEGVFIPLTHFAVSGKLNV